MREVRLLYGVSAATIDVDLIFDNAADVSVIGDERLALNLEPTHARLIGFIGARSDAVGAATLPGRLGKALYVPGAQNLLGSQALAGMGYRDQHRIPDSEGAWEIVHDDGEVLQFDPVDYDKKANFKLSLEEYYALAVKRFLQPGLLTMPSRTASPPPSSASLSSPATFTPLSITPAPTLAAIKSANGNLGVLPEGVELFHRL